jgi:hypothetical protein
MAVPHPGLCEKSAASIGSNSSAPSGDFSEIEATIYRLCDARGDDDGNRAAAIRSTTAIRATPATSQIPRNCGLFLWLSVHRGATLSLDIRY